MHTIIFWHKYHIHRKKIGFVFALFFLATNTIVAQKNVYENDLKYQRKKYHFGIHLGVGMADYRIRQSESFAFSDSVLSIKSKLTLGYEIGGLFSYHLHKNFELRVLPTFLFNDKNINFTYSNNTTENIKLPTIVYDMPIEIKFKSDPIKDFKVYVVAGMKYSYDIGSNLSVRLKSFIPRQKASDLSVNYGVGLELHFPLFILCPEFKISNSVLNTHLSTEGFPNSNFIQRLYNRTFLFSINFEG